MNQNLARLQQQMGKVKPWVYLAVALALLLGAFYAFQGMQYYNTQGIPLVAPQGNIATLTQEKISIEQELAKEPPLLESLESQLEQSKLRLEDLRLQFKFPATDDLLNVVSDTARESNLDLTTITTGDLKPETLNKTNYLVRTMSIALQGDPLDFSLFLKSIHQKIPVTGVPVLRFPALVDNPTARLTLAFNLLPEPAQEQEGEQEKEKTK